jgi:hypothetical protein
MDAEGELDYSRLAAHFPEGGDLTLQILKGHLLVEEQLRQIFDLLLVHPDALNGNKGTSFECHDVICLVEALSPIGRDELWLWSAAKRLNSLRNHLAHNLEPHALDDKVRALIKFVTEDQPTIKQILAKNPPPPGCEFQAVIVAMHAALSQLKNQTAARRDQLESAPKTG